MAKQHTTTLRFEPYSVGMMANATWGENWDAKYFVDNLTKMSFKKMVHDTLYDSNPKAQKCTH
jgi:hypothetical protein